MWTTYSSRRRHWPMAQSMKRCDSSPHSVTIACFSWFMVDCRESSTFIDHLLKGTPNSVIDWIQVQAVWGPHVRLDERNVLTLQVRVCSWQCVTARRPAAWVALAFCTVSGSRPPQRTYSLLTLASGLMKTMPVFPILDTPLVRQTDISQGSVATHEMWWDL